MRNKLIKMKRSDLTAWLLCLVAAFIIWLYVMSTASPSHEATFSSVPVKIENAALLLENTSLSVISDSDLTVDLTVSGPKKDFGRYGASDFSVSVDVSNIDSIGKHTLSINVLLPSGMTLESVVPSTVTLHVDNRITRNVPVRTAITSSPKLPEGCELGEITPAVTSISIEGPESILSGISHAQLDVSLGKLEGSVTKTLPVRLIDANGAEVSQSSLTLSRSEISVEIPVFKTKEVKLGIDTVYSLYNQLNSFITVTPSTITLRADPALLSSIDTLILDTINEKSVIGDFEKSYDIVLPDGVECISDHDSAAVKIVHIGTQTKKITTDNIKISSNPNGYGYAINTERLEVEVRASAEQLLELEENPDNISVGVSLESVGGAGTYSLPATITLRSHGSDAYELGEYFVSVTVKVNE